MLKRSTLSAVELALPDEDSGADGGAPEGADPTPSEQPPDVGKTPRARILIVEDDYLVGMEMEAGLTEAGFEVTGIATSAEEAFAMAAADRPSLVVMDIRLSGPRDGVEAATEIFSRLGIRSLFASAHGDPDVRARAEASRPLGWIAKPYRVPTLVEAVERALASLRQ